MLVIIQMMIAATMGMRPAGKLPQMNTDQGRGKRVRHHNVHPALQGRRKKKG